MPDRVNCCNGDRHRDLGIHAESLRSPWRNRERRARLVFSMTRQIANMPVIALAWELAADTGHS